MEERIKELERKVEWLIAILHKQYRTNELLIEQCNILEKLITEIEKKIA